MSCRFFLLALIFLTGCSCGTAPHKNVFRIGVDADWYPLDFGGQQAYVNGFTSDLLLDIARYSGLEFEKVSANWDALLEGMVQGKYDAVLTSLPPYPFNQAKYDFSENFLDLGPVLIVPIHSSFTKLEQMQGNLVGIIAQDPSLLLLQKIPEILVRTYPSIPDLFNALAQGEIQGALHNRIPAINYVHDLYADRLKIATSPLTDAGLHLVTPKGKKRTLLDKFDSTLKHFKKKNQLEVLQEKWGL